MSPNSPSTKNSKKIAVPTTDTSMEENASTNKFVFIMIGVIALSVIVGGVALYYLIGQYVKQSNKNKAQDITIGLMEKKQSDIEKLKPNYATITAPGANGKSDADLILIAMPIDEAYDSLIAMLENMAQQSNVKLLTISKTADSAGAENSYNISLSLSGSFNQILDFLSKTENSARVFDFVSMNIGGSTNSNANVTVSADFKTYFNPPANIAPKEVPLSEYNKNGGE
jgi:hypothetical protein